MSDHDDCVSCTEREAVFGALCRFCFYSRQGGPGDGGGGGPGVSQPAEPERPRQPADHIAANDPAVSMETPTA